METYGHKAELMLVADEVLHPIGKIQPLLIGLNPPDRVESFGREGAQHR